MDIFLRRNGELIIVALASASAYLFANTFFDGVHEYDPFKLRGIAALVAGVVTWVFWRLMVANGRTYLLLRGALSGLLSGLFMHPVHILLIAYMGIFDYDTVGDYSLFAMFHVFFFTFLFVPVTMSVGVAGGMLAVLVGRPPEAPPGAPPDAPRDDRPTGLVVRKPE